MDNDSKALGERMAELRAKYRHTQIECAAALGVAQSTYADMESGRGRIRRRDLVTIAALYGLTLGEAFPAAEQVA